MSEQLDTSRPYWDERIETLGRDELLTLQTERLRRQLKRCHAASALYRSKLESVGAEPGDLKSLKDLAGLPVTTKGELRTDQEAYQPFGSFVVAGQESWREVHPSSGTTGRSVTTIWSERDVETITNFTARTLWQLGVRPTDIIQNAFAYGLWVAGLSVHYAAGRIGALVVPIGTAATTARQVDYLRHAGSTVLVATPSYALHIAEHLREREIDPSSLAVQLGCFGGEPGAENPSTRMKIETGLGIEARDFYGLAEVGPTFASECVAKAGLHFAEDHVLVECLDDETHQPVPEGELGVLVFTHLTREASPMLRYWSNDYARLTRETCACGRTHIRAEGGILGRGDDLVIFRGAKFYPGQVEKVVRAFPELSDEFLIKVQREGGGALVGACVVVVEAVPGLDLEERLRKALRDELGVTPDVQLEPHGSLERTAFKAKRIVQL
jgi:phenylacetate-CoA ligase